MTNLAKRLILGAGALLLCLAGTRDAWASNRTVCFELGFMDSRAECPGAPNVNTAGSRRNCNPGGVSNIIGIEFEAWDKDSSGGDDFIGTWRVGATGEQCFTFDWTDDANDKPDVYLIAKNRVNGASGGVQVIAQRNMGTAASPNWLEWGNVSWRDGTSGNSNAYVASNCGAGQTCRIAPGVVLLPAAAATDAYSGVWMALESSQRTLEVFNGAINGTTAVQMRVDSGSLIDQSGCGNGCARWQDRMYIPFDTLAGSYRDIARRGAETSHELGHVLEMREFGEDGWSYSCNGGWSLNTQETESCATMEGFATYVGVVSFWNPQTANSAPEYGGFDLEPGAMITAVDNNGNPLAGQNNCATFITVPGQAAKGFWDLDDSTNEAAVSPSGDADSRDKSTTSLLNNWDKYPDNSSNHGDEETTSNLWDYIWNAYSSNNQWGPAADYQSMLYHNCMGGQAQ